MFHPSTTFNGPLPSIALRPARSHPPSPNTTMSPDAYARLLPDRGAAPLPTQANVAAAAVVAYRSGDTNASVNTNDTLHFASVSRDILHSSPAFASASTDAEDAEKPFERELADDDMAQYVTFDGPSNSPPFLTDNSPIPAPAVVGNNASSPSHASPPPSSDVDGTSPALSDFNSNFGYGSPSAALWSPGALQPTEVNTSPHSPPLSSPLYDYPVLVPGLGLGFDGTSDGAHGALFSSQDNYRNDYSMAGAESYPFFDANLCAETAGLGLGLTPHAESAFMPWDSMDVDSTQPQPQPQMQQFPRVDQESRSPILQHHEESMQMQGQENHTQVQQQEQQSVFPTGPVNVPPSPGLAPFSPTSGSPRGFDLLAPASAVIPPNTPTFAAQLWDWPTSSPTLSGDHGRSASDSSSLEHHGNEANFVLPPSGPAAVPISIPRVNNNTERHRIGQSLTQLFQPASAPEHHSGFGFMPPSESSPFSSGAIDNPFDARAATSGTESKTGSGNGSGFRARVRSYSQRLGSGFRDAQRMFSTRGTAALDQGEVQVQQQHVQQQGDAHAHDKVKLKTEEVKTNEEDTATVRVPFPRLTSSTSNLSFGVNGDDPDATVRRKKRTSSTQTPYPDLRTAARSTSRSRSREPSSEKDVASTSSKAGKEKNTPLRSELRPPKLAPSAWQLFFTEWIQHYQLMHGGVRKLNVAQAAKEAGAEYANLTAEQKEPYKRRSQALKEQRERELAAWQRTLTPEDIKRENAYRTAQRKAGKSRKGNLKDPNAPKKPLSAYFMFLQHIRADPERVKRVFGDEKETTAQSVLAAQTWRAMTDEERKPFLAQAEKEKLAYEAARRLYEEGTVGFETTISFSNTDNSSPSASGSSSSFSPSGAGEGTTFVIGTPAREMGLSSDSEPEMEMDSEVYTTDDEQTQTRRIGHV